VIRPQCVEIDAVRTKTELKPRLHGRSRFFTSSNANREIGTPRFHRNRTVALSNRNLRPRRVRSSASGPKGLKCQPSAPHNLVQSRASLPVPPRTNDTLSRLLGIMILTCRVRISRGRCFEITEAGNRFAESRFPLFRDLLFSDARVFPCVTRGTFTTAAALRPTFTRVSDAR